MENFLKFSSATIGSKGKHPKFEGPSQTEPKKKALIYYYLATKQQTTVLDYCRHKPSSSSKLCETIVILKSRITCV